MRSRKSKLYAFILLRLRHSFRIGYSVSVSGTTEFTYSDISNGLGVNEATPTISNPQPDELGITPYSAICQSRAIGLKKSGGQIEVDGPSRTLTGNIVFKVLEAPEETGQARPAVCMNDDEPDPLSVYLAQRTGSVTPSYSVSIDPRKVSLYRGGVDEYTDTDGVTHGHTVYSYLLNEPASPDAPATSELRPNNQTVYKSMAGNWGIYNYQWKPVPATYSSEEASFTMPAGNLYKYQGFWNGQSGSPTNLNVS